MADYARSVIENGTYTGCCTWEKWPPNNLGVVVSVAMITYHNRPAERQYIKIAKQGTSAVDKIVSKYNQIPPTKKARHDKIKVIKDINEIFEVDIEATFTINNKKPKRILIEGAPGIGKTVLAHHIALCWAKKEVLPEIDILFILFLRDPNLQKIKSIKELVQYVSMGYHSDETLRNFIKELENVKRICFVLDGYDEYPFPDKRTFITDLIYGGVFPNSLVVITSRPISTLKLHGDIKNLKKIEILGLAKEERDEYISQALLDSDKIKLEKYLKQQPIINGLCYIPLYLAILLYLFKQDCLPESLTEMNESFIIHTVYRHLKKYGIKFSNVIVKMGDLPIFKDFLLKMSKLAFNGLKNNQLVFKSADIDFDVASEQETKNGFGLLQAVQHYPKKGAGEVISFNFLHFTMQEFLAAYHVLMLSGGRQLLYMEQTFWEPHYSFMWLMYVGLAGVKSDHFVKFISEGKTYKNSKKGLRITGVIQRDKKKQLHVFQCYMEARSSITDLPMAISSMFKDGNIKFNNIKLLSYHVSCLTSFMSTSSIPVPWKRLELKECSLDDAAMNILELFIIDNQEKSASFEIINLSENLSSPWSVYCAIIKYCKASSLTLYGDTKHEFKCYTDQLKDSLESNDKLHAITLCGINGSDLSSFKEILSCTTTVNTINVALKQATSGVLIKSTYNNININICGELYKCTPESINVSGQNIDDQTISYIAFGLQNNTDLKSLNISQNVITDTGLLAVGSSLNDNATLLDLDISNNPFTSQGINEFVKAIRLNWNLNIETLNFSELSISDGDANVIGDYVNDNRTLLHFCMSKLGEFSSEGAKMFVDACQNNKTLIVLDISEINLTDDGAVALSACINNNVIQEMYLSKNKITKKGAKILAKAFKNNVSLNTFDISENSITNKGIIHFLKKINKNKGSKLRKLLVMGNIITKSCTRQIEECCKDICTPLTVCSSESDVIINRKLIIKVTMVTISKSSINYGVSRELVVKEISNAEYRIKFVCSCLVDNDHLTSINLSKMKITSDGAKEFAKVIDHNISLQVLDISNNSLGDNGIFVISDSLKHNETLQALDISKNEISSEGAKKLAEALNCREKCKLKKLNISENSISSTGIVAILDSDSAVEELNVSNNCISNDTEKFEEISKAIQDNKNLKTLNLFQRSFVNKAVFHKRILHALYYNNTITSLMLPWLHDKSSEKNFEDEVRKINEERECHSIKTFKCTF